MADDAKAVFDSTPAPEEKPPTVIDAPAVEAPKDAAKPSTTKGPGATKDKDGEQAPNHHILTITLAATAVLVVACLLWMWSPLAALLFVAACALAGVAVLVGGVLRRKDRQRRGDNTSGGSNGGNGGRATGEKGANAGNRSEGGTGQQRRRPNPLTKAGREARRKAAQEKAANRTPGAETRKPRSFKDRVTHPFRKDRASSTTKDGGSRSGRSRRNDQGGNTPRGTKPNAPKGAKSNATPNGPKGTKPNGPKGAKPFKTAAHVNPGAESLWGKGKETEPPFTEQPKGKKSEDKSVKPTDSTTKPAEKNKRAKEGAGFLPQADKRGRQVPKSDSTTNALVRPVGKSKRAQEGAAFIPKADKRGRSISGVERLAKNTWKIHHTSDGGFLATGKTATPVPNVFRRRDTSTNTTHNSGGSAMNTNVDALTKQLNTVNYGVAAGEQRVAAAKHEAMAVEARSMLQMLGDDPGNEESRNALLKQAAAADASAESRKRKAGLLDQLSENGFKF